MAPSATSTVKFPYHWEPVTLFFLGSKTHLVLKYLTLNSRTNHITSANRKGKSAPTMYCDLSSNLELLKERVCFLGINMMFLKPE